MIDGATRPELREIDQELRGARRTSAPSGSGNALPNIVLRLVIVETVPGVADNFARKIRLRE